MGTKLPAPHFLQAIYKGGRQVSPSGERLLLATVTVIYAPASAAAVYAWIFAVAVM